MIFFGSDWHLNDKNIFKYQIERKWKFGSTLNANNNSLINRQNAQVSINDTVYMIGDFIINDSIDFIINIVKRLNGVIYLLLGNHDFAFFNIKNKTIIKNKFYILHGIHKVVINDIELQLFHYPIYEQPNFCNSNSYHLHGHLHGIRNTPNKRSIDVSMNLYNYKLLSERDILTLIKNN